MPKFLSINAKTTLPELNRLVGKGNVERLLNINSLNRTYNIGKEFFDMQAELAETSSETVPNQRKYTLLNSMTGDSDAFETVALMNELGWKQFDVYGNIPNMLRIPDTMPIPDSVDTLGNGIPIASAIYNEAMHQIMEWGYVSPNVFSTYSTTQNSGIVNNPQINGSSDWFQYFKLPWGDITLYSSLDGTSIDFPVYPENLSDSRKANYETMPDMLYQYEPWQLYKSSGPREGSYTFKFHRDMWSGDHRDGKANELIRFCEANCYPEFSGSMVNTSTVTLYIKGESLITGVMTGVRVDWDGPIGLDGWYLICTLTIEIIEVSDIPLNYTTVKNKPLIG